MKSLPELYGERATLIKNLRKCDEGSVFVYAEEAADMLEADAREAEQAKAANSRIASLYEELRKAIDGGSESMTHDDALKQIAYWQDKEQAQAVEPVAWKWEVLPDAPIRNHKGEKSGVYLSNPKDSGIDIECAASVKNYKWTPLYLHPAPPAGEPTLSEILAAKGITLQKTFVEKPRDHVGDATAMVGERAELIAQLSALGIPDWATARYLMQKAAGMLQADAQEIASWKLERDEYRAKYNDTYLALDDCARSHAAPIAQQVAVPAPMTEEHIYELAKRITKEDAAPFGEVAARPGWAGFVELVRAIEAHHGIGAKP